MDASTDNPQQETPAPADDKGSGSGSGSDDYVDVGQADLSEAPPSAASAAPAPTTAAAASASNNSLAASVAAGKQRITRGSLPTSGGPTPRSSLPTTAPRKSAREMAADASGMPKKAVKQSLEMPRIEEPTRPTADTASSQPQSYRAMLLSSGGRTEKVNEETAKLKCVVGIAIASATEMIASTAYAGKANGTLILPDSTLGNLFALDATGLGNYALCVGLVSLVICLVYIPLAIRCPTLLTTGNTLPSYIPLLHRFPLSAENVIAVFLSLWWCIGACVATFVGPHSAPQLSANGYFSCWIGLAFSLSFLNAVLHYAPSDLLGNAGPNGGASAASRRHLGFLGVSALALVFASLHVVFGSMDATLAPGLVSAATFTNAAGAAPVAAAPPSPGGSTPAQVSCNEYGDAGAAIWALMVGVITLRDVVVLFAQRSADMSRNIVAGILVLLWLLTAIATTLEGPFEYAGNGYFAVWFGLIAACLFALECVSRATFQPSYHFACAALYTGSAVVIVVETWPFFFHTASLGYYCASADSPLIMPCHSNSTGAMLGYGCTGTFDAAKRLGLAPGWTPLTPESFCSASMYTYAFVYGLTAALAGGLLVLVLGQQLFAFLPSLADVDIPNPLKGVGEKLFKDGCCSPLLGIRFTALRLIAGFLLLYSIIAALVLTYWFPPYMTIDNGFLGCWMGVAATALLMRDEPTVPEVRSPRELEVVSTLSGDDLAAITEDGRSPIGGPITSADGGGSSANDAADAPPPMETPPPPWATGVAVTSILLLIAALERYPEGKLVNRHGLLAWAIFCSCLAPLLLLARWALSFSEKPTATARTAISAASALHWLLTAIVLSQPYEPGSNVPFADAGNGWLALWAGALCAWGVFFADNAERLAARAEAQDGASSGAQ